MARCVGSSTLGTPPDTYLYALSRSANGALATIGSDDALRLFDPSLKLLQTATRSHTGVACLTSGTRTEFITAGRDATIRCWDRNGRDVAHFVDPRGLGFSAIACHDHVVAAGNESTKEGLGDVSVSLFDLRNPSAPLRQYNESHTDSITQLAFHPTQPNLLLSGSTDGLVSIFNVDHVDEEDALHQVLNPRSAVHCAGYLTEDQIYVVSTDEQYSIYPLSTTALEDEQLPPPVEFGDVRETLQCMYVIDVLTQASGPPLMAYGHNVKQTLSVVSLGSPGSWGFGQRIDLPGAHGDDVVRDVLIVDQQAFTCGEDGHVKLWDLGRR